MEISGLHATILLVEDLDWVRSCMRTVVEREGFHIVEATNDADAIEIAERQSIDLILTEEELPTFNSLLARVREHPTLSSIPVVIVDPDAEDGARLKNAYLVARYQDIISLLAVLRR